MGRRRLRLIAALVAAMALSAAGCAGDPNSLDGSVRDFYALGFDAVRARLYSSELAIEYVTATGETVVRLTVRRAERDPEGAGTVDLTDYGDVTGSAGGAELPPFDSGTLTLDVYHPLQGAHVAGSFEALLVAGSTTVTVHGIFDTHLDVVEGL